MKVKLSKIDFNDIKIIVGIKLLENFEVIESEFFIEIISKKKYFEELLDVISDKIMEDGIDDSGEINFFGNKIEKIIDIISVQIYE
jgi:hypothetical protein